MLDATPQSTLSIVYKKTDKQAATHAHLFVALKGATTQYIEKEITAQTDKVGQWTSFETTLADMGITQDCKVAMIGLRLTNTPKDYNMLVGEVALRDPKLHFAPPTPKVEDVRILRGKHNTFDFKARYTMTHNRKGVQRRCRHLVLRSVLPARRHAPAVANGHNFVGNIRC